MFFLLFEAIELIIYFIFSIFYHHLVMFLTKVNVSCDMESFLLKFECYDFRSLKDYKMEGFDI